MDPPACSDSLLFGNIEKIVAFTVNLPLKPWDIGRIGIAMKVGESGIVIKALGLSNCGI
jgi:hypothetical protein